MTPHLVRLAELVSFRPAIVGVTIGCCVLGGYLLRGGAPPAKKPSTTADQWGSADVNELKARVVELEHAVALNESRYSAVQPRDLAVQREGPVARDPSLHVTPDHDHGSPPSISREELLELDARREQRFGELLRREPRDRSWALDYEASLRDAVHATAQGDGAPTIETLSCRTSICRLQISSSSSGAQRQFMQSLHAHLPPMAAVHWSVTSGDDGSSKTTLDFVRQGYPTAAIDGPVD
jgi:outer membrane murein-binding lipoprotein Lpp